MARFKKALWEDPENKQRIKAREITEDGSRDIVIDRNDTDNFNAVIAEFPEDVIDKATEEDIARYRQERSIKEQQQKEADIRQFQETLFNEKIEIFKIDEVAKCEDKLLKRRIRKANTFAELYAYTAVLIVHGDLKDD